MRTQFFIEKFIDIDQMLDFLYVGRFDWVQSRQHESKTANTN